MSTEAVVIPIEIPVETSSLDTAKAKLREAEALVRGLKDGGKIPTVLEIETSNAKAHVKDLTAEVKALERAQKDANAAAVKAYQFQQKAASEKDKAGAQGIKDLFGTSVFDLAAGKIAGAFGKGKEETAAIKDTLIEAGGAFATVVGGAVLAIGAAGVGLVTAGVKFGIEQTAQRQKNTAILDKLTKGQGAEAEEFSKKLAGDTGTGEDEAMQRVKGLIQAGFDKEQTGAVFTAAADIGEVKGQAKAELFIKTLEKVNLAGAASEKSVKALLGAGVERSELLEGLKETGETTASVEARLKAGKVSAEDFSKAATGAVQKDIGGVAGKGLDAMFNRAKIAFDDLFDNFDISGIEELGGKLTDALGGEQGAALKEQITAAGNSVLALTKNITAADIKGAFTTAGEAAATAAAAIKTAAGFAADLWNTIKQVSGSGSHMEGGSSGDATGDAIEQEIAAGNRRAFIKEQEAAKLKAAGDATGKALADGIAQGIEANAAKPAAAASAMVGGTIDAGNAKAKIKSPSQVTAESGKNIDEGLAIGIDRNAGKPEAAAADMMRKTTRAAGGGASQGTSDASSPGSGGIVINIGPFNLPAGSPEATKEAARAGVAMATPALLAALRTVGKLGGAYTGGPSLP